MDVANLRTGQYCRRIHSFHGISVLGGPIVHRAFCLMIFVGTISLPGASLPLEAQGVDVSVKIIKHPPDKTGDVKHKGPANAGKVVVWLTPLQPTTARPAPAHQTTYRLV